MLVRERPLASIALPPPAPLPNLREALARRAMVFGPCDLDEVSAAPRGFLARCAAALRGVADPLEPATGEACARLETPARITRS